MNPTRTLIHMIEFCTNNRSMEEILLTAVDYYSKEYQSNQFILDTYVKSLQGYILLLENLSDYKSIAKMSQKLLRELEEYENNLLSNQLLEELENETAEN